MRVGKSFTWTLRFQLRGGRVRMVASGKLLGIAVGQSW
jgi:hypothetical protein